MPVYNYADVCDSFSELFDKAKENTEVIVRRENGELYLITLVRKKGTAYNLPETELGLSRDEIDSFVRETRER